MRKRTIIPTLLRLIIAIAILDYGIGMQTNCICPETMYIANPTRREFCSEEFQAFGDRTASLYCLRGSALRCPPVSPGNSSRRATVTKIDLYKRCGLNCTDQGNPNNCTITFIEKKAALESIQNVYPNVTLH
jgi:hypothetical protein